MKGFLQQLWSDAVGLFVVPAVIALCPARIGMALSLRLAPRLATYTSDADSTLVLARSHFSEADASAWRSRRALNLLRDHVDLYHWLFWGDYWFRHHVKIVGDWPASPAVTITFHWGGGLWGLYSLRQATGGFAGVAATASWAALRHRPAFYLYVVLRTWATHRLLGKGLVFTGNAARHLVRALLDGKSICGLYDSPALPQDKVLEVRVLNQALKLPRGLPALSVGRQVPLVTFAAEPDMATGGTLLTISPAVQFEDEQEAAQHLAETLSRLIRHEPAYWHHWYLCGP